MAPIHILSRQSEFDRPLASNRRLAENRFYDGIVDYLDELDMPDSSGQDEPQGSPKHFFVAVHDIYKIVIEAIGGQVSRQAELLP